MNGQAGGIGGQKARPRALLPETVSAYRKFYRRLSPFERSAALAGASVDRARLKSDLRGIDGVLREWRTDLTWEEGRPVDPLLENTISAAAGQVRHESREVFGGIHGLPLEARKLLLTRIAKDTAGDISRMFVGDEGKEQGAVMVIGPGGKAELHRLTNRVEAFIEVMLGTIERLAENGWFSSIGTVAARLAKFIAPHDKKCEDALLAEADSAVLLAGKGDLSTLNGFISRIRGLGGEIANSMIHWHSIEILEVVSGSRKAGEPAGSEALLRDSSFVSYQKARAISAYALTHYDDRFMVLHTHPFNPGSIWTAREHLSFDISRMGEKGGLMAASRFGGFRIYYFNPKVIQRIGDFTPEGARIR